MKSVEFERRFFKNDDEWEFFLFQLDVEDKIEEIKEISLNINEDQIYLYDSKGDEL